MQHHLSAYPDVAATEFAALLEAALAQRGQSVVDRLEHPDGRIHPELSRRLTERPSALAYSWWEPPEDTAAAPATVVREASELALAHRLALPRAISAACGGWALSLASDRWREQYAVAAFYAGRTVEALAVGGGLAPWHYGVERDATLGEDAARSRFEALYRAVCGGSALDLRPPARGRAWSWIVSGEAAGDAGLPGENEPALRRAGFVDVSAAQVDEAIAALPAPGPIATLERRERITASPFVLLDGDFDDAWFTALAWRLGTPGAAIEFAAADERFTWCEVDLAGAVRAGADRGADALARVWSRLAVTLGGSAAMVRWAGVSAPG